VPFVGWQKIELIKSAVEKIKNTEGSTMSVGLLAVYLQYGFYVFGHRSKFINTMQFKLPLVSLSVFGRPNIGYNVSL
jgi:hypothetical protein